MFERFTEKGIKVIMLAQEEARRLGHNFVGTEQILLGLIGEGTGIAAKCLNSSGVTLQDARIETEKIIGKGSGFVAVEIPFTPRAKRTLEFAWKESRQLGTDYVDTQHLLLGIIREGEGVAARVLENLGINFNALRQQVLRSLPGEVKSDQIPASTNVSDDAINQLFSSTLGIKNIKQLDKVTRTANSLLEFLIDLLSLDAQKLVKELEDVVRHKEHALRVQQFEQAAALLDKQIELTEKLRLSSPEEHKQE